MADPVTEISDRNGFSEEEALFYLQEFKWDFNSAMEACRNQTLLKLEAIDGTTPHDAVEYLTRSNWNIHVAVGEFLDDSREMIGSMDFDKTESLKEASEALMAVSQANVETSVCKESAETIAVVIDWNQLSNDTLIDSFLGLVGGVTREKAITLLRVWNWDVSLAVNDFFDHPSPGVF